MVNISAQLTLDLSGLNALWTSAKGALTEVPALVTAVQQARDTITVAGAVGGTPGTVTFTTNASTVQAKVTDLRDKLAQAQGHLDAIDDLLTGGLPVTVSQVTS